MQKTRRICQAFFQPCNNLGGPPRLVSYLFHAFSSCGSHLVGPPKAWYCAQLAIVQLLHFSFDYQNVYNVLSHFSKPMMSHFLFIPLISKSFMLALMAFTRTGLTDCMIPSLVPISLICGCTPLMAFIFWLSRHRVSLGFWH